MTLHLQFVTMLVMTISGVYVGLATDTYRRLTRLWKRHITLRFGVEIIYWVGQTVLLYSLLYRVNDGQLGVYVFLACLCGFAMYQSLFKGAYLRLLEWIIHLAKLILQAIARFLSVLVLRPLRAISRLLLYVIRQLTVFFRGLLRFLFYPITYPISLFRKKIVKKLENSTQKRLICSTIRDKLIRLLK